MINTPEDIVNALSSKLDDLGVEGVYVDEATIDTENEVIHVEFSDDNGDSESVIFGFDDEGSPYATVVADEDNDTITVDLSPLEPTVDSDEEGEDDEEPAYYIDLVDNDWLNLSTIKTILTAGNIMANESMSEVVYQKVVRGGKVVKIPVVIRKHKLNAKQKAALAKARKKSHTGKAMKARAKSLSIRKRANL